MAIKKYGVWVGRPIRYEAETEDTDSRSPHIYLYFEDDQGNQAKAAINVKSIGKDSRLVYWLISDLRHLLTDKLRGLSMGFHLADEELDTGLRVDFYRTSPPLLTFEEGRILPHDIPGPDNDILDELKPLLDKAISEKATVYIFGSAFGSNSNPNVQGNGNTNDKGIHDIHMNQGSLPQFDNATFSDGALLFRYSGSSSDSNSNSKLDSDPVPVSVSRTISNVDDRFDAVFLAFASQRLPTDERGLSLRESRSLASIVENAAGGNGTS